MKNLNLFIILFLLLSNMSASQGCLPIRNIAGFGQFAQLGYARTEDEWMLSISGRYFDAYQSFIGEKKRPAGPPENRFYNYNRTVNFSLNHLLNSGWSVELDMPFYSNSSVGKAEHLSGVKHSTEAFGMGDIRFTVYKWLLNTDTLRKGNVQFGIGIKLPTGDYRTQDYFYHDPVNPSARVLAAVDPSIQLGDGGTGFIAELNGFYILSDILSTYINFFYLINPRDQNGVSNQKGIPLELQDPLVIESGMEVNSVPDNYTFRTGMNFTVNKLVMTYGVRYEGAPAHDLFGENNGLRRVGHIFSFEPGLQYKLKKGFLYSFFTLPVTRMTIQTEPDKTYSSLSGKNYITPGRFANFLVFIGFSFTF